jgi:hypothetical protein
MLTCVGPPDVIAKGSPTVLINNLMAARIGDLTAHGGVIVVGFPTVMIGEVGAGRPLDPRMGNVLNSIAASKSTSSASSTNPRDTPQSQALEDAAKEGIPTVEKCPYADH